MIHAIPILLLAFQALAPAPSPVGAAIEQVQPKMVKVYGAGGLRGMEAWQSGFLISPEGHILTVWSYVLDTDVITVVLNDGREQPAKLLGADPQLEIAVLKIDAADLPCFDLAQAVDPPPGTRILAVSNLFNVALGNEPVSVQRGTIAVKTRLEARRGVFETPYSGPVYVLDVVTNNPGAAGGALVTWRGELVGLLGKELRNSLNNTWLNYALPIAEIRESVERLRGGQPIVRKPPEDRKKADPMTLGLLGLTLVPDLLDRTPPYIDRVTPGSSAARAGVRPDDLVVVVGDRLVQSCRAVRDEMQTIDRIDKVKITVLRGQQMMEFVLEAAR